MAQPLAGLRVIELAGLGPSQLGAMILSDLGADVVRVDRVSTVPDLPPQEPSRELLSRGRRSVALDLKSDEGRAVALRLITGADVLIDPYRPGALERLGLAPAVVMELNPRLVFARMTGWGQAGPLAAAAGHDLNYISLAGALEPMGVAGEPPQVPLNLVGDFGGGAMPLAVGVLAALLERERSQLGQVLDVAMIDGVATLLASVLQMSAMGEWSAERGRNWVAGGAPWYRAYRTQDERFLTVGPLEERFYNQLLERLGLEPGDWPQWDEGRWPALADRLAGIFATGTLERWCDEFEGSDVCFAPVLSFSEAAAHPQLAGREVYVERNGMLQPSPSPRLSRTPGEIGDPPPWPGADTWEVLLELGLSEVEIRRLLDLGVARELPQVAAGEPV